MPAPAPPCNRGGVDSATTWTFAVTPNRHAATSEFFHMLAPRLNSYLAPCNHANDWR